MKFFVLDLKKQLRNAALSIGMLGLATLARAIDATTWSQRATVVIDEPGFYRVELTPEVFDRSQLGLADLRLLDPEGREAVYEFVRPTVRSTGQVLRVNFDARMIGSETVIVLETGTDAPLDFAGIETAPGDFLKPVQVEISVDGERWDTLVRGFPLFRREGATQLSVPLERRRARHVRLTLDDRSSPPIALLAATIGVAPFTPPERTQFQEATITRREEFFGETVLTLDLGAAHLPLAALEFDVTDPVFYREVTLAERVLEDGVLVERVLAWGALARRPSETNDKVATLPLTSVVVPRELIVHIENGDSPPLVLSAVHAQGMVREIVFSAPQVGTWMLLTGNPTALRPHYDVARFIGELSEPAYEAMLGPLAANPDFHPLPETLAEVSLTGATLDTRSWMFRRRISMKESGVQQLELDLDVLAGARMDFADLRLMSNGRQIPYLLEPTRLTREFPAVVLPADDLERPRTSRWRIVLPRAGLPLRRLVFVSSSPLFQRRFRLLEMVKDDRGRTASRSLAEFEWVRQPDELKRDFTLMLENRVEGNEVILETDNGDNPAIALDSARAAVGVTRVLFKPVVGGAALELIFGNRQARAPRYDLALVATHIIGAEKKIATLEAEAPVLEKTAKTDLFSGRWRTVFFWAVLSLVVVTLLVIVARLLPKP